MAGNAKKKLVDFLEKRVFRPVMAKSPDSLDSDRDREKLKDVQESTEAERKRFRDYPSAEKVREMYHDDLSSKPAQRIQRYSRDLGLPALPDVKEEFDRLCEELGVGPEHTS